MEISGTGLILLQLLFNQLLFRYYIMICMCMYEHLDRIHSGSVFRTRNQSTPTINDLENMKLVEIPIFPYGYGGIQEFRLMDVGIPSERIDTFVVNQQTDVDLTLSTGERVQYSGLEGNGLHLLRFWQTLISMQQDGIYRNPLYRFT